MNIDEELRRAARHHRAQFETTEVPELAPRSPHRTGTAFAIVAAILVVLVAAATVAVATNRSRHRVEVNATIATTSTTTPRPNGPLRDASLPGVPLLVPTSLPPGVELASLSTESIPASPKDANPSPAVFRQLFGKQGSGPNPPALLLMFQPAAPNTVVPKPGPKTVRLRNTYAGVSAPKDSPSSGVELIWVEGNVNVTATTKGMTQARSIAVLDALRARGGKLGNGFDPASAPADLPLVGEDKAGAAVPGGILADFKYSGAGPTANGSVELEIQTRTNGGYPGYLATWLGGRLDPDKVAVQPGYWGDANSVLMTWPDGHDVALHSPTIDEPTLEHIARAVALRRPAQTAALMQAVNARLAALPLIDSVAMKSGTLELHGPNPSAPIALCMRVAPARPVCHANSSWGKYPVRFAGTATRGTQWLVFAALPDQQPMFGPRGGLSTEVGVVKSLPAERAKLGTWNAAIFIVPANYDDVQVELIYTSENTLDVNFIRPAAG